MSCGREKAGGRTGAGKGCPPGAENARKEKNSTEEQFHGADFVIRLVPAAGEAFWRLPTP